MFLNNISPGDKLPDEVNVVIEIPAHSSPVKYEMDKQSGALIVDRFMSVAMYYPCNYGFIPHTLSADGDPLDVLVVTPHPVIGGSLIACRPIGVLNMVDESGPDAKVIAVPVSRLYSMYDHVKSIDNLPMELVEQITHFFEQYKTLEKNKWVKIGGWASSEKAKSEIIESLQRYVHVNGQQEEVSA